MARPDSFSETEWETCIKVLQVLSRDPDAALDVMTLKGLVTKLSNQAKKRLRQEATHRDRQTVANAALWQGNAVANHPTASLTPLLPAPLAKERLNTPRRCYVCKQLFDVVHHHYHMHCPACAESDFAKRAQRADLRGRTALVTGGRIKIGWQLVLRLLRDGARVIMTTRFPRDAAIRFSQEADFDEWRDRLQIYGLDFRNLPLLEQFIAHLRQTEDAIDILINNAAQTIRREPVFYEHLRRGEALPLPDKVSVLLGEIPAADVRIGHPPSLHLSANAALFPAGLLDRDGQQVDLSPTNSWIARAEEVSTAELLEVLLVSQSAPFLLASRLRSLLKQSPHTPRFIVNVSAMEGQFQRSSKTAFHPHTNMAKAALNMFTRTSAQDFATDAIWMNSVDTGWITDENPFPKKTRMLEQQNFVPPLDAVDGMARVYAPIVRGIENPGEPFFGHFLKDYGPHPW